MPAANFGTVLPRVSLLATIGIVYSVLAPIINGFATISSALLFLAWKFLLTQVFDQPSQSETGGLYFPLAVTNLYIGLYIEHIALTCLFFLDSQSSPNLAIAGGVLMLVLLAITALSQILVNRSFSPISDFLPMSLATKDMVHRYNTNNKYKSGALQKKSEDVLDLFNTQRMETILRRRPKFVPRPEHELDDVNQHGENKPTTEALIEDTPNRPRPSNITDPTASSRSSQFNTDARPQIAPVAPAIKDTWEFGDEEYLDEHAFDHPSMYVDQPWIWIPKDTLGFAEMFIKELQEPGISASCIGANMDQQGTVDVERNPPDEEWSGGHDR